MKKIFKAISKKSRRVNKVFLAGFTVLTLLSFVLGGAKPLWCVTTFLGYSLVAWQVIRDE